MKAFMSLAVIIALGSVGWVLGGEYYVTDPDTGQRLGAFVGGVFGLLIFLAVRARE